MRKKNLDNEPEKPIEKVEEPLIEKQDTRLYIGYSVKLENDFYNYKKGKTLDATLMPLIVNREENKWENKWFIFDAEKFVGYLPSDTTDIMILSQKKIKK
jgi:hypothetical protein